jgi:hypothetical protein
MSVNDSGAAGENGFAIVWFTLLLVVLLGFAGVAVDVSNWWRVGNRLQATADAAALAGAVRLPGPLGPAADEAQTVATANGYPIVDTTVDVAYGATPAQLRVTTRTTVDSFFLHLLGIDSNDIRRTATAEFQGPIPMGSPENLLGMDPENTSTRSEYWLSFAGQAVGTKNGDRFGAGRRGDTSSASPVNPEYSPNGYFFVARVTGATAGKDLVFQAYDPGLIVTNGLCQTNMPAADDAAYANIQGLNTLPLNPSPAGVDGNPLYSGQALWENGIERYARRQPGTGTYSYRANPYCTGDDPIGFGSGPLMTTTFQVRAPSGSPWDPAAGPIISTGTCAPEAFGPVNESLAPLLDPADPAFTSATARYVQRTFHRWVPICRVETPVQGDYVIQVMHDANSQGQNRFSLRAGLVNDGSNAAPAVGRNEGVQLFAFGRQPVYVNAIRTDGSTATPTFFLAEVPDGNDGRILTLEFFDIGDTGKIVDSGPASNVRFELLAPNGSPVCTITPVLGSASASGCSLLNIDNVQYQDVLVVARIQLPTNYTCNPDPNIGCWFRIRMTYGTNTSPTDFTTWVARLEGDPVRLVPNQ